MSRSTKEGAAGVSPNSSHSKIVCEHMNPRWPAFSEIRTPALVINLEALKRNIKHMSEWASASGIALRPHAKTHKCANIAKLQMSEGAKGISCATLGEAEALVSHGIANVLITSPIVGDANLDVVASLERRSSLTVTVDNLENVAALQRKRQTKRNPLPVLIDIDVGQRRAGVADSASLLAIAKAIATSPALKFVGLQGFAGHAQHIVPADERATAAKAAAELLRQYQKELERAGITAQMISGSGTGTFNFDMSQGPYTELQVGSYVFMDADYGRLQGANCQQLPFERALFVLATVISSSRENQITIDAGTKALAINGPTPGLFIGLPEGSRYSFAGDEHGVVHLPAGAKKPSIGSKVLVETTHCDPTVNLYSGYHVLDKDQSISIWPIIGRHGP